MDGRLKLILGVIGIVIAAALGIQRLSQGASYLPFWVGVPIIVGLSLFVGAGIIAGLAYWPQAFDRPPSPAGIRNDLLLSDPREAKLEVIDTIVAAYEINAVRLKRKIDCFKVAFGLASAGALALIVATVVQIALQTQALS